MSAARRPWIAVPLAVSTLVALAAGARAQAPSPAAPAPTLASLLEASQPYDWRPLDPENTLYLDLPSGRVVMELYPAMAPRHVENVKTLAREGYFDGLSVNRAQDNYVAQWGDPESDDEAKRRPVQPRDRAAPAPPSRGMAGIAPEEERPNSLRAFRMPRRTLPAEFDRAIAPEIPFMPLPDGDVYAPEVGWSHSFPVGRDPGDGRTWIAHCYGTLGSARGNEADSGGGTQLYVVIGHAPRHLDRNTTTLGRVVQGIELLSTLPRGSGPLGVYEKPEQRVPIRALRVAADVPAAERVNLEVLRTDTPTFAAVVEARRNRREEWFKRPAGRVELCNVPLPVRPAAAGRTDP